MWVYACADPMMGSSQFDKSSNKIVFMILTLRFEKATLNCRILKPRLERSRYRARAPHLQVLAGPKLSEMMANIIKKREIRVIFFYFLSLAG